MIHAVRMGQAGVLRFGARRRRHEACTHHIEGHSTFLRLAEALLGIALVFGGVYFKR